jgi:hypothetical protein
VVFSLRAQKTGLTHREWRRTHGQADGVVCAEPHLQETEPVAAGAASRDSEEHTEEQRDRHAHLMAARGGLVSLAAHRCRRCAHAPDRVCERV